MGLILFFYSNFSSIQNSEYKQARLRTYSCCINTLLNIHFIDDRSHIYYFDKNMLENSLNRKNRIISSNSHSYKCNQCHSHFPNRIHIKNCDKNLRGNLTCPSKFVSHKYQLNMNSRCNQSLNCNFDKCFFYPQTIHNNVLLSNLNRRSRKWLNVQKNEALRVKLITSQ